MDTRSAKLKFLFVMIIWASVPVIRESCAVSSGYLAFARAFLGAIFLLAVSFLSGNKLSLPDIRKNALLLLTSGAALGLNWVFLFEAYKSIPISAATFYSYLSPVIVLSFAPLLFHEKLRLRSVICVIVALIGMVFISSGVRNMGEMNVRGVVCSVISACCYAYVTVANKKIADVSDTDRSVTQLLSASVITFLYAVIAEPFVPEHYDLRSVLYLLVLGFFCTGVAYYFYFAALPRLYSMTIAILSYANPLAAIVLAVLLLHEKMTAAMLFGGVLVLGSALVNELLPDRKKPDTPEQQN